MQCILCTIQYSYIFLDVLHSVSISEYQRASWAIVGVCVCGYVSPHFRHSACALCIFKMHCRNVSASVCMWFNARTKAFGGHRGWGCSQFAHKWNALGLLCVREMHRISFSGLMCTILITFDCFAVSLISPTMESKELQSNNYNQAVNGNLVDARYQFARIRKPVSGQIASPLFSYVN